MSPTPLERVLARLPAAREVGQGWRDRCPVHQGASDTSLSLRAGQDGRVLLHCHAGCTPSDIVQRLGLSMPELFPTPPASPLASPMVQSTRRIVATYDYCDASGRLSYQTVRTEPKGFIQRRPDGRGGWITNLGGVERVLYHLPELLAAPQELVFLVEGEKDADALIALGLLATTAVGGANAPWLPQYSEVLHDRHLVLLGDNDSPGEARVHTLAKTLFPVAASVRLVRLPGLPPKGDVSDWIAAGGTVEGLRALVDATPILTAADLSPQDASSSVAPVTLEPPLPLFPIEVFPEPLHRYVAAGAAAIGVPVDFIAIPLLGFAAATIGNTRALRVKAGWIERPILWLAVIGEPGSGKSPALSHARHLIDVLQQEAWEHYQDALVEWELEVQAAKAEKPPAPLPPKPVLESYFTTDATIEAMAPMLEHSPGLVMLRDELVGWVLSHDAYRKAGDRQHWLSQWAGAPLKVDRRTSPTIYVPKPTSSVVGGIQPDLLGELAAEANRRDGFVDRLLAGWPAVSPPGWTEATVPAEDTAAAVALFKELRRRPYPEEPHLIDFTPQARASFAGWVTENAALIGRTTGLAAGYFAKYPGQCARVALILHCLHHPADWQRPLDVSNVQAAITVAEYFRAHLQRVLPAFGASSPALSAGLAARVTRLLQRESGAWVSRTTLHRGLGGTVIGDELSAVLAELAAAGVAETRTIATGARGREEWRWVGEPEDPDSSPSDEYVGGSDASESSPNSSFLHSSDSELPRGASGEGGDLIQETYL